MFGLKGLSQSVDETVQLKVFKKYIPLVLLILYEVFLTFGGPWMKSPLR